MKKKIKVPASIKLPILKNKEKPELVFVQAEVEVKAEKAPKNEAKADKTTKEKAKPKEEVEEVDPSDTIQQSLATRKKHGGAADAVISSTDAAKKNLAKPAQLPKLKAKGKEIETLESAMKPVVPKKQKEEESKIEIKASVPISDIAVTESHTTAPTEETSPIEEETS
jgi:primase-polymerase (primpol)-like protein